MLILSDADIIQVQLAAAHTTDSVQCVAAFRDIDATTFTASSVGAESNGTTTATLVSSPAASVTRVVDFLNFYNADSIAHTVTVLIDFGGTTFPLWSGSVGVGERVEYAEGSGFRVFDANGLLKTQTLSQSSLAGEWQSVILASDVTNNNAVANTIADVTGLSFAVTAGEMYWFEFNIFYTSAATTTGSRWSVNGPAAPTKLIYTSEYSLAATTTTRNANNISYDLPAASNATSSSTGSNQAYVYGCIQPSSNGTVIARFASEVASSAIVAKAGSFVRYLRTV